MQHSESVCVHALIHSKQRDTMAFSTAAKPQPLHNFSLPDDLRWAISLTSTTRFRKSPHSAHRSPPNHADSGSEHQKPVFVVETSEKKKKSKAAVANLEQKPTASSDGNSKRSKFVIRIPAQSSSKQVAAPATGDGDHTLNVDDFDQPLAKPWNLRPRKAVTVNNDNEITVTAAAVPENKPRPENVTTGAQEILKRKLSIPLSKKEIEDDILFFTGSKPSRRPKKRARNLQKQLDYVFPGLWLDSITPDSYKVNAGNPKG